MTTATSAPEIFDSISSIGEALKAKSISCSELTAHYLDQIKKQNGELNCFVEVCDEAALGQARQIDSSRLGENSPLSGIPVAIKDNICTEGVRTTCASKILENFVPPYSATVVNQLSDAGAVMLGKTNMDEFAMGSSNENSYFGPVKNPWDTTRVPGGSSGGSAAAVAAGLAPFALGSDTGGSIRQPCAFCGLTGIKPTYGRVSRHGLVAFASSLDQIGPIGRTVGDCAAVLMAICGADKHDSTSVKMELPDLEAISTSAAKNSSLKGVRVGIPKEYFITGTAPAVSSAVKAALAKLEELGAELVEISLPNTEGALATYYIIAPAEASSNLARFDGVRYGMRATGTKNLEELYTKTRSQGFGAEVKQRIIIGTYVLSSGFIDAYYYQAQRVRRMVSDDFTSAFADKCDIIASPTTPTTAFKIGEKTSDPLAMYLNDVLTIPVNLAGLPAMSLPCGFDADSLPIGLQLIGKPWDEAGIFKVGAAYQSVTEWHRRKAPGVK